ncbi:Reticulocyte-binding protein 2-like protein a, partial [Lachnellula suecica]
MEVYLLSAQFPGPTAPRDFVTMFMTSDQALEDKYEGGVPRHFMVISKPCKHPDAPPREGYIRGQYESVEFIREIPLKKGPQKSASTTNLETQGKTRNRSGSLLGREAVIRNAKNHHSETTSEHGGENSTNDSASEQELSGGDSGRARGKTISFDKSRGPEARGEEMDVPREDDETESNPVEWIMITRSDPGGSVPRFMIERGTPGGIVSDASKFLNWACAKDIEDLESDGEGEGQIDGADDGEQKAQKHEVGQHNHEKDLHNWQTNGHLAGIEEAATPTEEKAQPGLTQDTSNGSGIYAKVAEAAGVAGGFIASYTPAMISDHLPQMADTEQTARRESVSSIASTCSSGSFASALERRETRETPDFGADGASMRTTDSANLTAHEKELQKLEDKKRKLDEKLNKAREKELSKKSEDSAKEEEAIKKAEEKHEREVAKQEEKYKKEVEKLEQKKAKEARKAEDKKRKQAEKDDKVRLARELEEIKAEVGLLRQEKDILRSQVGDLQAENTALAAKLGKLGGGDEVLKA